MMEQIYESMKKILVHVLVRVCVLCEARRGFESSISSHTVGYCSTLYSVAFVVLKEEGADVLLY